MSRHDNLNQIMRGLASALPTDRMRLALLALIGRDGQLEFVGIGDVSLMPNGSMSASQIYKHSPALTLDHVLLIKNARHESPEPWRQIVEAIVSYVEDRDMIDLYEIERELIPCNACGGEPFTTVDGEECTACGRR